MCTNVSLLTVLPHLSLNVQSSDTERSSFSYLIKLVFKLFCFPLISSSKYGFGSLGTPQKCGVPQDLVFLVLLLVGFPCFGVQGEDSPCFSSNLLLFPVLQTCIALLAPIMMRNRNREPLIAYEPSEFLSVLFHVLRHARKRGCYSVYT